MVFAGISSHIFHIVSLPGTGATSDTLTVNPGEYVEVFGMHESNDAPVDFTSLKVVVTVGATDVFRFDMVGSSFACPPEVTQMMPDEACYIGGDGEDMTITVTNGGGVGDNYGAINVVVFYRLRNTVKGN